MLDKVQYRGVALLSGDQQEQRFGAVGHHLQGRVEIGDFRTDVVNDADRGDCVEGGQ